MTTLLLEADYSIISNYSYFSKDFNGSVKPFQLDNSFSYLRIKFSNDLILEVYSFKCLYVSI